MTNATRILCPKLRNRIMSAREAAALIPAGANVGMSGFTGAGYPKAVPQALAEHIRTQQAQGRRHRISIWTGASTAPELDGALAEADGIWPPPSNRKTTGRRIPVTDGGERRRRAGVGESRV